MRADLRNKIQPIKAMIGIIEFNEKCATTLLQAAGGFGLTQDEREQFIAWSHESTARADAMAELMLAKLGL
jgi:hypothetical protein